MLYIFPEEISYISARIWAHVYIHRNTLWVLMFFCFCFLYFKLQKVELIIPLILWHTVIISGLYKGPFRFFSPCSHFLPMATCLKVVDTWPWICMHLYKTVSVISQVFSIYINDTYQFFSFNKFAVCTSSLYLLAVA